MMVEHDAFDLLADEYPRDPEKVQVAARFSISRSLKASSTSIGAGAAVGIGAGEATAVAASSRAARTWVVVVNMAGDFGL